jgi:DNA-binding CsgD family transcriptional regulator
VSFPRLKGRLSRERIIHLKRQGLSNALTARRLGIHVSTVTYWMSRLLKENRNAKRHSSESV